ncbi:hypothetical protein N8I77_001633 [Diaporthe amygdali]|uniref:Beta-xylanase n=1 Tax=Phomopsis amygdali TaxID=1214568 RepID=A0AAD9W8H1_PHOAM|nr:Endo-1-4-beta-xylanase 1 [Diaporthe amygdali]KAJ0118569.1 Endo-1-4-beta-xylanase 1 [Diaporthe amygdali]KAK2614835.1 hypothetical protein N8I77_001633 [Diaporthe amygdali]
MRLLFAAFAVLFGGTWPVSADGLNVRAQRNGLKYFGSQVSTAVLNDAAANAIAIRNQDFGTYTCEYEQKFANTEPSRDSFSYTLSDRIVNQALRNGIVMRCHNLIWHKNVPSWVTNGNFDNSTIIAIIQNHIANVVTHFKGKCYAWDVVNEAIDADGTFRGQKSSSDSVWYSKVGPAFIPIAFAAAAAADPSARLYYNDYNIEYPSIKTTAVINLVKSIQEYGAKIDGVGLQGHFNTGELPSSARLVSTLTSFAALGVDVAYTELDLGTPTSSPDYAQQALDFATVVRACKQVSRCVGITTWGFTDRYTYRTAELPDLWDTALQKKQAYYSTLAALGPDPLVDVCGCAEF